MTDDALLTFVEHGIHPDSDAVASKDLNAKTLPQTLRVIRQAKKDTEAQIVDISRKSASDVDGWILQAEKLQNDIQRSKDISREIVREAEEAKKQKDSHSDVEKKLNLLELEVNFNRDLSSTLDIIRELAKKLEKAQDAAQHRDWTNALRHHDSLKTAMVDVGALDGTIAFDLLKQRSSSLRNDIFAGVDQLWDQIIYTPNTEPRIIINKSVKEQGGKEIEFAGLIELSQKLDILDSKADWLCRQLNDKIIRSRLESNSQGQFCRLKFDDNSASTVESPSEPAIAALIDDLTELVKFLSHTLPSSFARLVAARFIPDTVTSLTSSYLPAGVDPSLESIPSFDDLLRRVSEFSDYLASSGWYEGKELMEWVEQGPKIWLGRRRELALLLVRDILDTQITVTKDVERIESQVMDREVIDQPAGAAETAPTDDDWDAGWGENEEQDEETTNTNNNTEAEDLSAWDSEPVEEARNEEEHNDPANGEELEEEDAWGWEEDSSPVQTSRPVKDDRSGPNQVNGNTAQKGPNEQRVTLKEVYTVTGVPDKIIEAIKTISADAESLRESHNSDTAVAAVGPALYSLFTVVLSGFRALANAYYAPLQGGLMYLYNDCTRLISELSEAEKLPDSTRPKLSADTELVSRFSKLVYGREMDSQRQILRDLLKGTQGFERCTEDPFADECENAIIMVTDHLREVYDQWVHILSSSVLLQSIGSLLSTVINKIISDICRLSDISETKSHRLKHFCDQISKLSTLFVQPLSSYQRGLSDGDNEQNNDPDQNVDVTGVYTRNWFKFQYLAEIMESNLAEVKYLWQEGELSLEFEADEVVQLIEALFAESDYRNRTVKEIEKDGE